MNSPPSRGPEPRSPKHLTVSDGQAGQRLDNWLFRELKSIPKSHIYRLIRTGQVRVGGGRCRPSYRVQRGDEIRIPPQTAPDLRTPRKSAHAPPDFLLQPLYEDADLLHQQPAHHGERHHGDDRRIHERQGDPLL